MCGYMLNNLQNFAPHNESNAVYGCNPTTSQIYLIERCGNQTKCNSQTSECARKPESFRAIVQLNGHNLQQNTAVKGSLILEQVNSYIEIHGAIKGLNANSLHAIHVHETGRLNNNCSDTGPHFNPDFTVEHGGPPEHSTIRHAGDLGNVETNSNGTAIVDMRIPAENICIVSKTKYNILYRSIVVHINRDDLGQGGHAESKSNGNSGKRIACGLIEPVIRDSS